MKKADILILPIPNVKNSNGILTGKLFEYLAWKGGIMILGLVAIVAFL